MRDNDGELGTAARFIAAGGASTISAVVVNPFDVVKVESHPWSSGTCIWQGGTSNEVTVSLNNTQDS